MDDYRIVNELVYEHGHWSDLSFSETNACILTKGGITSTGSMFFDKMPEKEAWSLCCARAGMFENNYEFIAQRLGNGENSFTCITKGILICNWNMVYLLIVC